MNRFTIAATFLFLSLAFAPLLPAEDQPDSLLGTWEAVYQEIDGKAQSNINYAGMQYVFGEGTYELHAGQTTPAGLAHRPPLKGTYTIDNSQSPRHLTLTVPTKKGTRDILYIYELKGDVLTLCFTRNTKGKSEGGVVRPTSFQTKETNCALYRFKRVDEKASEHDR